MQKDSKKVVLTTYTPLPQLIPSMDTKTVLKPGCYAARNRVRQMAATRRAAPRVPLLAAQRRLISAQPHGGRRVSTQRGAGGRERTRGNGSDDSLAPTLPLHMQGLRFNVQTLSNAHNRFQTLTHTS